MLYELKNFVIFSSYLFVKLIELYSFKFEKNTILVSIYRYNFS